MKREFNLFLFQLRLSHLLRFLFRYVCIMKLRYQNVYIDGHLASNNHYIPHTKNPALRLVKSKSRDER